MTSHGHEDGSTLIRGGQELLPLISFPVFCWVRWLGIYSPFYSVNPMFKMNVPVHQICRYHSEESHYDFTNPGQRIILERLERLASYPMRSWKKATLCVWL
jgi:hypothetical protein